MEKKSVEIQAKTVDQAIMDALVELGASYEDVEFEILSQGGFLKKAKVRVSLKGTSNTESKTIQEKKEEPKKTTEIKKEEPRKEFKTDKPTEKKEIKPQEVKKEKPAVKSENSGDMPVKFARTLEFTQKLMELLGNGCKAEGEVTENTFNINISGENLGQVIGKGGEVLNAIQALVSAIAISCAGGESKRVYVNAEDYKERRKETLVNLAMKKAEKVKATGRYIKLEPMNSRDRAIVHSALQEVEGIRTYSTGKDPFRCLCIAPKKDSE